MHPNFKLYLNCPTPQSPVHMFILDDPHLSSGNEGVADMRAGEMGIALVAWVNGHCDIPQQRFGPRGADFDKVPGM